MDLGSGVAIGVSVLAVVGGTVKLYSDNRKSSNSNGKMKHCEDHSGVCQFMESMDAMMAEMRQDIKTLIMRK